MISFLGSIRYICLLIALCFVSNSSIIAQSLDSLAQDSIKKYYYRATLISMRNKEFKKALSYTDTIRKIADRIQYDRGIVLALLLAGEAYQEMGDFDKADNAHRDNLRFIATFDYDGVALGRIYKNLYTIFSTQNNQDSAQVYTKKIIELPCNKHSFGAKEHIVMRLLHKNKIQDALDLAQRNLDCSRYLENNYKTEYTLTLITSIYAHIGDYETSLLYLDTTLQVAHQENDSVYICLAYDQLGYTNIKLKDYHKSVYWFRKAIAIAERISYNGTKNYYTRRNGSQTKIPLGSYYTHLAAGFQSLDVQKYQDSILYYQEKALNIHYENRDFWSAAMQLINIGQFYIDIGNYQRAIDSLQRAYIITPQNDKKNLITFYYYSNIAVAYRKLSQYKKTKNSLDSAEILAIEMQDTSKLIEVYEQREKLYVQTKDYEKAHYYLSIKKEIEEKMQNKKNKKNLLDLEIKYETEQIKNKNLALRKDNELQAQALAFNQKINTRNLLIIIGLIFLLLLVIGIAYLRNQRNKLYVQFKTMELEQKALKAQINPHFFFNVLNSLQGTILSEKPMVAYRYHTKFTKLMRLILSQSDTEGISLKEELDALQLYLELEQLRTGNAFDFDIQNKLGDISEKIVVPSMLLQPFVENSIWHGVMNREAGENKKIQINIDDHAEQIVCEIIDTGVGRQKATKIKAQKTIQYKSMGMQVTQNRLDLFKLRYKMPLNFFIEDLKDKTGKALGTKVLLEIPKLSR